MHAICGTVRGIPTRIILSGPALPRCVISPQLQTLALQLRVELLPVAALQSSRVDERRKQLVYSHGRHHKGWPTCTNYVFTCRNRIWKRSNKPSSRRAEEKSGI